MTALKSCKHQPRSGQRLHREAQSRPA